jgi:multiple sugar transport system substrate-binding protein
MLHAFTKPALLAAALLTAGAASAQKITLNVTSFPDLDRGIKLAIPLYQKLHPDVEIKLTSLAFGDHHTAMTTMLATGANVPDVMAMEVGFIGKFAESNGLEDLAKAPYNAGQLRDKLTRYAYPLATSAQGAQVGLPVDLGAGALFYRKDLLDKAGVTEAELTGTWESFIEAGKKVKATSGAYLLANAVDLKDIYIRASLKDGEGIYFDAKGKPLVTTPRFEKAFALAKAARTAGIDGKINAWTNEWSEGFKRDKIAAQMMGCWLAGHLKNWLAPESAGKWRSAQLPGGAYASWGGSFYGIPKKARNKAAAWDFIKFLSTSREMQVEAFRGYDAFPALVEALDDPFVDQPIEYLGGQKARQLWKVAASKVAAYDVDKFDAVAGDVVNAELEKVLEQNKDIKAALKDAQAQLLRRVRR